MDFKNKIRILYCLPYIITGGVEKRRLFLSRNLNPDEYELKIICIQARGKIATDIEANGVEIISLGEIKGLFDFKQYRKLLNAVAEFRPHIIHGAVFEGVTMACVAGFLKNVPIVIAEETSDPQNRSKKASLLLRVLTMVADKVIAIAPAVGSYLEHIAKIPKYKIRVINNGVALPRIVSIAEIEDLKSTYGIKPGDIIIGSVGRLHNDHKRFTDLITAVASVPDKDRVKIFIVGSGPDEQLIKDAAERLGLKDQLYLPGYQSDMSSFYALMDIFCLVSQREGFGLVAAEAMLCSLPVIATKVGGLKNVVIDMKTGFLVPPMQPLILAERIQLLIDDPDLRRTLGIAGYERAKVEYTEEIYCKKVESLYKELLNQKKITSLKKITDVS